jgi:hypothetical protein
MIRSLFCALAVVVGLDLPALAPAFAEESGDLQAIRARQLYIEGKDAEAFAAIKPLADQGIPRAEVILGFFYERGIGTEPDAALAVEWYRKAADKGQPAGLHNLAYSYENGELGLPVDEAKAYELYLKAVEVEYAPSIHNLGRMYIYGTAPTQDVDLGRALLERAVSLGLSEAAADYGYMLATGDGLPVDLARARDMYFRAAAQGVDWAQRDLGEMLELGEGGPVDLVGADTWYRKAQDQGYVMAGFDLAEMIWANPDAFPGQEVEALAWCFWAEANGPGEEGEDYTGKCADPAAKLPPEDVARAKELALTF